MPKEDNSLIPFLSLLIALLALTLAARQARRITRLTANAHQIQVISDAFREIRSTEFREHYRRVLSFPRDQNYSGGLESLPISQRESAYAVCYFFEHLGVLVTRQLVSGEVLISTMRTLIIRSWKALEPAISAELDLRRMTYPDYLGHDFIPHFRLLVELAMLPATAEAKSQRPVLSEAKEPAAWEHHTAHT